MHAARAILTTRGGMTSHAAVVARGMGRACVAGAGELRIDLARSTMRARDLVLEGRRDHHRRHHGEVMLGEVPTIQPELSGDFAVLMTWADKLRTHEACGPTPTRPLDCRTAERFGAEGIGLCRTEHMFFDAERIIAVREMILADREAERRKALDKILPMQRDDFVEIFRIMGQADHDPPARPAAARVPAQGRRPSWPRSPRRPACRVDDLRMRAIKLDEANPMLGHRGCRLGITYPEIYEMQARAIFEAAVLVAKEGDGTVEPEIMIPLIAVRQELEILKARWSTGSPRRSWPRAASGSPTWSAP